MEKDVIASGTFTSLQGIRDFLIKNADNLENPEYECPDYFYNRWTHTDSNSEHNQTWDAQEIPGMKIGELIVYHVINHNTCFYRYGMVAKICDGTVVTSREIFIAYDLGPAIGISTSGRAISFPVNPYSVMQLCRNVRNRDWVRANGETISLLLEKQDLTMELQRTKNKVSELESLLTRPHSLSR